MPVPDVARPDYNGSAALSEARIGPALVGGAVPPASTSADGASYQPGTAQLALGFDSARALEAREAGMARVERSSSETYKDLLEQSIRYLALNRAEFTSDDIRRLAGDPPASCHPNIAGAVVNRMARAGVIRCVGYGKSARVVGHSNLVRVWAGAR